MLRMQLRVFNNTKKALGWFRSVYLPVTSQSLKDKILSEIIVSQGSAMHIYLENWGAEWAKWFVSSCTGCVSQLVLEPRLLVTLASTLPVIIFVPVSHFSVSHVLSLLPAALTCQHTEIIIFCKTLVIF